MGNIGLFLEEFNIDTDIFDELMNGLGSELIIDFTAFLKGEMPINNVIKSVAAKVLDRMSQEISSGSGDFPEAMLQEMFVTMSGHLTSGIEDDDIPKGMLIDLLHVISSHLDPHEDAFIHDVIHLMITHLSRDDDVETIGQQFIMDFFDVLVIHVSTNGSFSDIAGTFEGQLLSIVFQNAKSFINGTEIWNVAESLLYSFRYLLQEEMDASSGEDPVFDLAINLLGALANHIADDEDFLGKIQNFLSDAVPLVREDLLSFLNDSMESQVMTIVLNHIEMFADIKSMADFELLALSFMYEFIDVARTVTEDPSMETGSLLPQLLVMVSDTSSSSSHFESMVFAIVNGTSELILNHIENGDLSDLNGTFEGDIMKIAVRHLQMMTTIETEGDLEHLALSFVEQFAEVCKNYTSSDNVDLGNVVPDLLDMISKTASASSGIENMIENVIRNAPQIVLDHLEFGDLSELNGTIGGAMLKVLLQYVPRVIDIESMVDLEFMVVDFIEDFAKLFYRYTTGSAVDVGSLVPELLSLIIQHASPSESFEDMIVNVVHDGAGLLLNHIDSGDLVDINGTLEGNVVKIAVEHAQRLVDSVDGLSSFETLALSFVHSYAQLFYEYTVDNSDEDLGQILPNVLRILANHSSSAGTFEDIIEPIAEDVLQLLLSQFSSYGDMRDLEGTFEGDVIMLIIQHVQRYMQFGVEDIEFNVRSFISSYFMLGSVYLSSEEGEVPELIPDLLKLAADHIQRPWSREDFSEALADVLNKFTGIYGDLSQMTTLVDYMELLEYYIQFVFSNETYAGECLPKWIKQWSSYSQAYICTLSYNGKIWSFPWRLW